MFVFSVNVSVTLACNFLRIIIVLIIIIIVANEGQYIYSEENNGSLEYTR